MEWNSEAIENLQGCLDFTDRDVFRTAADIMSEYTEAVTSHTRVSFDNDKAFFSPKPRWWQNEEAFKSGDTEI